MTAALHEGEIMMTHFCTSCDVYWAPYMTGRNSCCPECGSGLTRSREPLSKGAVARYAESRRRDERLHAQRAAREDSARVHERFEDFYLERERERDAAQPTESIDALEVIGKLATRDPEEHAA